MVTNIYVNTEVRINSIYKKLSVYYGSQKWWPGESKLECAIGAVLTQNTSWVNVEKAIKNIKSAVEITMENFSGLSVDEIAFLIKPAGFYNQKARSIKYLVEFINYKYGGKIENMKRQNLAGLRKELLSIKGIGPETADCILLYGLDKPVFVIDRYTYRVLYRHGFVESDTNYNEMQKLFMDRLENETGLFGEFHALLVEVGKKHCKKRANCEECPLNFDTHNFSSEVI